MIIELNYGFRMVYYKSRPEGKKEQITLVECSGCNKQREVPRRHIAKYTDDHYCQQCSIKRCNYYNLNPNLIKTEKDYEDICFSLGITLISKVPNRTDKDIMCRCNTCSHEWRSKYSRLYLKKGCPKCANHVMKTEGDYIENAQKHGFVYLGPLPETTRIKTYYKCVCGERMYKRFDSITAGRKCKKCHSKDISGENSWLWEPDQKQMKIRKKMRLSMSAMVHRCLKNKFLDKKSIEYLNYTREDLQKHLEFLWEDWMSWENYGEWEIDHIISVNFFLYHGVTDPKIINCLANLRPIHYSDNSAKNDKIQSKSVLNETFNKIQKQLGTNITLPKIDEARWFKSNVY